MVDTERGSEHNQEGVFETTSTIESLRNLQQVKVVLAETGVIG
jgi:hypothetical protein